MRPVPALRAGGTLEHSALYIERPEDTRVYELLGEGTFVNILTTRQMGKSSLMTRLKSRLSERGFRTAALDLAGDIGTPESADAFYRGLIDQIALDIDVDLDVAGWWTDEARGTPNQRLLRFFRDVVGRSVATRVVIFLDEIDSTLKLPYSDDLFTAIRALHNERPDVEAYQRITFCLLGTATPGELIKDRRTTPYNVGQTVELGDFDAARDDLEDLERAMGQRGGPGKELVRAVLSWTGGHPYLTMAVCRLALEADARSAGDVERLVRRQIIEHPSADLKIHFEWINNFLATRLQQGSATFQLYADALAGRRVRERTTIANAELRLSGLVKAGADGHLVVRNRIYMDRFGTEWLRQARPPLVPPWLGRAALGAVAIAVLTVFYLVTQARLAEQRLETERQKTHRQISSLLRLLGKEQREDEAERIRSEASSLIMTLSDSPAQVGIQSELDTEYNTFWERKAQGYDRQASNLFARGKIDSGLLFSAAAAVKRGRAVLSDEAKRWLERSAAHAHGVAALSLSEQRALRVRFYGSDHVVALASDGTLAVWGADNTTRPQRENLVEPTSLATGDGLVAIGRPRALELWAATSSPNASRVIEPRRTLAIPCDKVWSVALGPSDGERVQVAVGCDNGRAYARDVGTSGPDAFFALPEDRGLEHIAAGVRSRVYAVGFGTTGRELITGSLRLWGVVWALESRTPTFMDVDGGQALAAAFAPGNADRAVVAGHGKSVVYAREGKKWMAESTLSLEGFEFVSATISPDGSRVLNAVRNQAHDGYVIVWEPKRSSGVEVLRLSIPGAAPVDAEWAPDGRRFAAAMSDGSVRIFSVEPSDIPGDAEAFWSAWQSRLGISIEEEQGEVRPLWPEGFTQLRGPRTALQGLIR
ncbi:AAA-like domain-containing protein [Sorangium sp. So ce429]